MRPPFLEFNVERQLTVEEQLMLQRNLRREIDQLFRGMLRDFARSGIEIPPEVFLIEVTVEQGSIKAVVRYSRAAALALMLAIAGCQHNNPPTYQDTVRSSLERVEGEVSSEVTSAAGGRVTLAQPPRVQVGILAEIDQTLSDIQTRRISPDEGVSRLVGLFEQIDRSPERVTLVKALTAYIETRYGPDFIPALRQQLGGAGAQPQTPAQQVQNLIAGPQIIITINIQQSSLSPEMTAELTRQVIAEELKRHGDESGDDWIPIIGAYRRNQRAKMAYDLFLLLGAVESLLQFRERFKRWHQTIKNKIATRAQERLAREGVKAEIATQPSEAAAKQVTAAAERADAAGGKPADLKKELQQEAKSAPSEEDREYLEKQASEMYLG